MEEVLRLSFDLQRTSYKLKLILLPTHATIKKANNKTSRKGLSAELPFLKSIQAKRKEKKKQGDRVTLEVWTFCNISTLSFFLSQLMKILSREREEKR